MGAPPVGELSETTRDAEGAGPGRQGGGRWGRQAPQIHRLCRTPGCRRLQRPPGRLGMELGINAGDELFQLEDHPLDARLSKGVVVLHRIKQQGQAPERIGLGLR
eukprot:scaffold12959_cov116-Isochrysis_galbana.AAC.18